MKTNTPRKKRTLSKDQLKILQDSDRDIDLTGAYRNGKNTSRDLMTLFDAGLLTNGFKITDEGKEAIKSKVYYHG